MGKYQGPMVKNTETFIMKARWRHENRYDYSGVEYINKDVKVCVVCPDHGEFWQLPNNHCKGNKCPECSKINRALLNSHDQEWFIEKCRESHGYKYDYSETKYKKLHEKVTIICRKHGRFSQTPWQHIIASHGCRMCASESRTQKQTLDTAWFIEKAQQRFGSYFDYSKTEYVTSNDKLEIICPAHGGFWQLPATHLNGHGCPKCLGYGLGTEGWIQRFKEVHGDTYDYNAFKYEGKLKKGTFICKEHGVFKQLPDNHLSGKGCQKCAGRGLGDAGWIKRFLNTHGECYDYSIFKYNGNHKKSKIICPKHGVFLQSPICHSKGQGCPRCAVEGIPDRWNPNSAYGIRGFYGTDAVSNLYVLRINDSFIKAGLAKEIHTRMNTINKESGYSVEKLYSISGKANDLFELEQKIIRKSNLKRFYPEESFAGFTECLELSELPRVLQIIEDWEKGEESFSETS